MTNKFTQHYLQGADRSLHVIHRACAGMGDRFEIHGYGHTGYLQTTDNVYLEADKNGTWDFTSLALLFSAKINNKSQAWLQLHSTTNNTRLDWAYVDYQLTPNLTGRAGQIKMPVGLYNEIIDVKFLHLSTLEPMLYQGASEIVEEAFRGISGVYHHNLESGSLSWDAYLGQIAEGHEGDSSFKPKRLVGRMRENAIFARHKAPAASTRSQTTRQHDRSTLDV